MRKTFVVAFVALLAVLALVSCDNIIGEKPEYDADGRQLVTLSIDTNEIVSNSRSLTIASAHKEALYAEVTFKVGGKFYHAAEFIALGLKVKIPVDTYTTADAVLLIGRKSDGTLLATGALDTGAASTIDVTLTNPTVSFIVTSLEADIHTGVYDNAGTPTIVSSSFVINEGSPATTPISTLAKWKANSTKIGTWFDGSSFCFQVPTNVQDDDGIVATLAISGLNDFPNYRIGGVTPPTVYGTGDKIFIVDGSDCDPALSSTDIVNFKALTINTVTPTAITDVTAPAAGAIGKTTPISFSFKTPANTALTTDANGYHIISFGIPVRGFGSADCLTWFIRGGTGRGNVDTAGEEAEGVALLVTDTPITLVDADVVVYYPHAAPGPK
jgi:hypothetical protein